MGVAVVGAGTIGLACAYELVKDGHDVTVVDAERPGSATHGSAAKIALSETTPVPAPGVVLRGGFSLGFPTGMSTAADDGRASAARVSVVGAIGYAGFLAGPTLVGLLGDHVGVGPALLADVVLLLGATAISG